MNKYNKALQILLTIVFIPLARTGLTKKFNFEIYNYVDIGLFLLFCVIVLLLLNFWDLKKFRNSIPEFESLKSTLLKRESIIILPPLSFESNLLAEPFVPFNFNEKVTKFQILKIFKKNRFKKVLRLLFKLEDRVIIIVGDAGTGKSTFLRFIVKESAKFSLQKKSVSIPFILNFSEFADTSESFTREKIHETLEIPKNESLTLVKYIVCIDGFNEVNLIKAHQIIKIVFAYCEQNKYLLSIIISTRTSFLSECRDLVPRLIETNIFFLNDWSHKNIKRYFKNIKPEARRLDGENIELLSNPFIASLYRRQIQTSNSKEYSGINHLIGDYLESIFQSIQNKLSNHQQTKFDSSLSMDLLFQKISFKLISNNKIKFDTIEFLQFTSQKLNALSLEVFTKVLVDFGLLINADNSGLYKFKHQIFQEFLCAKYISKDYPNLVLTKDADLFWKDVPPYVYDSLDTTIQKKKYINLLISNKDFYSAATILNKYTVPSHEQIGKQILTGVINSLGNFDSYAHSEDVVKFLFLISEKLLLREVSTLNEQVLAPEEFHYDIKLDKVTESKLDLKWRVVGRSIHLLNLAGSTKLVNLLSKKVRIVCSTHLNYHILEYCLRSGIINNLMGKLKVLFILAKLRNKQNDEIIKLYKLCIFLKSFGINSKVISFLVKGRWQQTFDFVKSRSSIENSEFFLRSFWVRNHGIECLGEYLPQEYQPNLVDLMVDLIKVEEEFEYKKEKPFYIAVYKSILRTLDKISDKKHVITQLACSTRIIHSDWAIKYFTEIIYEFKASDETFLVSLLNNPNVSTYVKSIIKRRFEYF